ncbi:LEAF RUST 10 DISEASE-RESISTANCEUS RECEPTOR-LIKE PROTEIN KINASE-like 2.5 [Spinacia oleracea]|uniref:non-specific serine/threonine protein kinase n=1 Tax=Spinacia oleracea TaxID=3562 RepID=A0A9R0K8R8_SPIOL|nr:LEAF RUST 10 DISEASE-RESISTANCE LOCUS RECEPTOR-LIKE PROTEIN KINASE-like 2.5 [Spinacia oleracea]
MMFSAESSFFLFIIILLLIQLCKSVEANEYEDCRGTFVCRNVSLSYPFYDGLIRPAYCGYPGFQLDCSEEYDTPEILVTATAEIYRVLQMDSRSQTVSVARNDFWTNYCPERLFNTTLNYTHYRYPDVVDNFTLYYECTRPDIPATPTSSDIPFYCSNINPTLSLGYFMIDDNDAPPTPCHSNIIVPLNRSVEEITDYTSLQRAFRTGYELEYIAENELCDNCRASSGECGYDINRRRFACYNNGSALSKKKLKTILIVAASSVVGSAMIVVALVYFTRRKVSQKLNILTKEERRDCQDVEAMLRCYGERAPKRYTYREIKKMTSRFKEKLGEGGYGGVYKGKLQNGSVVAVKLLKNVNCKGADFINEVSGISGTNHVNIVTLLGYCFQGRKRALVYDFLPNGSLDKYIYCDQNQTSVLEWETLLQIAIGIGRGLEYLHQGCRTRILHFDIKPHNILLDAKFCPKISDFGLAKPCLQTESLMTMSGTRGTPGYIAPEVFCRGFGGASHKSDAYSFGMLVLDLVGCRKNNVAGSDKTSSELYFPHYIYKQFQLNQDQDELLGISNDGEKALQRKMVIVSLWCIQTNPSSRPSISKAVEMLQGDLELLQIPPVPCLSSPPS